MIRKGSLLLVILLLRTVASAAEGYVTEREQILKEKALLISRLDAALVNGDTDDSTRIVREISEFSKTRLQVGKEDITRRDKLELVLHVYGQLAAKVDPAINPNERFSITVPPPPGVPISGMDPKDVEDPVVRKQYEDLIREHSKKIERIRFQKALPTLIRMYRFQVESVIQRYFPDPKEDRDEILDALEKEIPGGSSKGDLLQLVGAGSG